MPHHLRYLTGFEYVADIKYIKVLNMLRYSYNDMFLNMFHKEPDDVNTFYEKLSSF